MLSEGFPLSLSRFPGIGSLLHKRYILYAMGSLPFLGLYGLWSLAEGVAAACSASHYQASDYQPFFPSHRRRQFETEDAGAMKDLLPLRSLDFGTDYDYRVRIVPLCW